MGGSISLEEDGLCLFRRIGHARKWSGSEGKERWDMCGIGALFGRGQGEATSCGSSLRQAALAVLSRRGPDASDSSVRDVHVGDAVDGKPSISVTMIGAVLHLRGESMQAQPVCDDSGNMFCWNGEVFGGHPTVPVVESDTKCVYSILANAAKIARRDKLVLNVTEILSKIQGPFSFLFWDNSASTLWWGRDAQGRRSLLTRFVGDDKTQLIISSSSFPIPEEIDTTSLPWVEVATMGLFSAQWVKGHEGEGGKQCLKIEEHPWHSSQRPYNAMVSRPFVTPPAAAEGASAQAGGAEIDAADVETHWSNLFLDALSSAVKTRTLCQGHVPTASSAGSNVAVLFSGGLDCTVIAALLHHQLPPEDEIDLLNVCFDFPTHSSPDRLTALASYYDLKREFPTRVWRFVLVNVHPDEVEMYQEHILHLISPMTSQMDFNIGAAFWFASRGRGFLHEDSVQQEAGTPCKTLSSPKPFLSCAKIIFTGIGADEQLGGYARHYSAFHRFGGWSRLQEELVLDTNRLWERNHGRDDRCISDHGKEARYPFLDEEVVKLLASTPLWIITDPRKEKGVGDKSILRVLAKEMSLHSCMRLPKRAIQFGSRIAKQSAKRVKLANGKGSRNVKGTDVFDVKVTGSVVSKKDS